MSTTQKYSPIRSTASKTNTVSQKSTYTPASLSARTANSARTVNTASASQRLPTVRTATSSLQSSAKTATKKVDSTVKDLQSTTKQTVKSIDKTVTPIVRTVVDPIVETATNISTSIQGTTKETIRTIENSPITKRFLGLFVVPFQKYGGSILALMVLIFGIILVYREMTKGKPVEVEKKNMIGKIVYETFNKDSNIESFSSKNNSNKKVKKEKKENLDSLNPQTNCPSLKQGIKHNFCKTFNSDKVSDNCLEKRCQELKETDNCNNAKCCKDNKFCEGFTQMNINSDYNYINIKQ